MKKTTLEVHQMRREVFMPWFEIVRVIYQTSDDERTEHGVVYYPNQPMEHFEQQVRQAEQCHSYDQQLQARIIRIEWVRISLGTNPNELQPVAVIMRAWDSRQDLHPVPKPQVTG